MRLAFFGAAAFAVPCLEALIAADHELLVVVSQPDRPTGRGMALTPTPVKNRALQLGLAVMTPENARSPEFTESIRELRPDALAVAAYGRILSRQLLDIPPYGGINVHGSLLPKYRGAAPIQHAILNGDTITGVTIMQMDKGMDTGDMLLKQELPIDPDDTCGTLEPKLAQLGAAMLVQVLANLGDLKPQKQNHSEATFAPTITKADARIRWEETAQQCRCRIRAFTPRPGAFVFYKGKQVKLLDASVIQMDGEPSSVIETRGGLIVACAQNALRLDRVQPEGKAAMSGTDFINGFRLNPADRFD